MVNDRLLQVWGRREDLPSAPAGCAAAGTNGGEAPWRSPVLKKNLWGQIP